MQVLYQLSYGPVGIKKADRGWTPEPALRPAVSMQ